MSHLRQATFAGFAAIALWSTLALLSRGALRIPAWQLLALTFGIGTCATLAVTLLRHGLRGGLSRCAVPAAALALGFTALFGFHALYFHALKLAPAAPASLIVYLWPLLITLGAAIPSRDGRAPRIVAAGLGLLATMLVLGADSGGAAPNPALGYALAGACALTWAGYSLANRRFANLPAETLIPACALTALAGLAMHASTEHWVAPSANEWGAVLALGLGPVGGAFLLWDFATKRGDLGLLGSIAYAAPVLSTAWLALAGFAPGGLRLFAAAGLIVLAAIIGQRRLSVG